MDLDKHLQEPWDMPGGQEPREVQWEPWLGSWELGIGLQGMQGSDPGGTFLIQEQWEKQGCSLEGRQGFGDPFEEEEDLIWKSSTIMHHRKMIRYNWHQTCQKCCYGLV